MHVTVGGRDYELSETLQSDELAPIFADAWTASRVWTASCFLAEHLVEFATNELTDAESHSFQVASTQASVIELGSGCGLAGIVAAVLGAKVVLSDQRTAVELLERNVQNNLAGEERASVVEYRWGTSAEDAGLPHATFDFILISDCINPIYGTESWRNLARSIDLLSHDKTITYLAHEARGEDEAMTDFLAFSESFLAVERIVQVPQQRLSLFKIRSRR
ncbi:hypothetical protein Poli38472_009796 [Pythium oligandrum]|uniref:Uncharacterized protein n=1 Tax=Pythium oligandrum TaxID=41045 RepID=A0A8K1CGX9_PYTOL|nr:hypothetical protein Poli38472_009796 [Pythium oligandrum]|eukprot:TMW62303.1 hypothetical protein Poli38472_009796 [Pythium oligandrum]